MSDPNKLQTMMMRLPPSDVSRDMAVASVLAALTDVLLVLRELPAEVERQLAALRQCIGNGDLADISREALKTSAICETAKRDIGR